MRDHVVDGEHQRDAGGNGHYEERRGHVGVGMHDVRMPAARLPSNARGIAQSAGAGAGALDDPRCPSRRRGHPLKALVPFLLVAGELLQVVATHHLDLGAGLSQARGLFGYVLQEPIDDD